MNIAIKVENLGKKYTIKHNSKQLFEYKTLQDEILLTAQRLTGWFRKIGSGVGRQTEVEEFWALKDIDLEIKQGDRVGIIGRNGAGKSTLLKILSRITSPTTGRVSIKGRVSSLLEVGTGFHPELTGRENIFLNGAILGMKRNEIKSKFDEIVSFSEVERFLDTPVKRYSSGMYVRLAFAVAAHLEPEVLIVDEVLAVGDAEFQRKCIGKMKDVASSGRTLIFVSHNMAAITSLCNTVAWIENSKIEQCGNADTVVNNYLLSSRSLAKNHKDRYPVISPAHKIGILGCDVELIAGYEGSLNLVVTLELYSKYSKKNIGIGLKISSLSGVVISLIAPSVTNYNVTIEKQKTTCSLTCKNIDKYLSGGEYIVGVWLSIPKIEYIVKIEDAGVLNIPPKDIYGTGEYFHEKHFGCSPLYFYFASNAMSN